jgi:hypothetical protein
MMIWQITSYVLHSWRFPFLAAVREPFTKFCLNNSLLPIFFGVVSIVNIIKFQHVFEAKDDWSKLLYIGAYVLGIILIVSLTLTYFFSTNRSALRLKQKLAGAHQNKKQTKLYFPLHDPEYADENKFPKVDFYFSMPYRVRHTRNVEHYPKSILQNVYKQHYLNALFVELCTIGILIGLSSLIDFQFFRIPAAASVMLFFAVITILVGAFSYWLRGWRTSLFILLFVVLNFFSKCDGLNYKNKVYGLNYNTQKAVYNTAALEKMCADSQVLADRQSTLVGLNNWLQKNKTSSTKPYLFMVNVSGGGSRSALWTFSVLQHLDSLMNKKLMNHVFLITGASGGMLGAAYYRELYRQYKNKSNDGLMNHQFNENIGNDMLQSITTSIAVNDMFVPWVSFEYAGQDYKKDRGYAFERQFNDNTNNVLDKKLTSYANAEQQAQIPWLIINSTIINDGRSLMISAQPVSYLCRPNYNNNYLDKPKIDAVDFCNFFKQQQADSIRFTSALRMNCTFPYILPNASLPSVPGLEVMDAGIKDNYGFETSLRFIYSFNSWISDSTAGLVLLQISDYNRSQATNEHEEQTTYEQLTNPITNVFYNFPEFQYYTQNNLLNTLQQSYKNRCHLFRFEYTPAEGENRASLSFHLTSEEKKSIAKSVHNAANTKLFNDVVGLVKK